MNAAARAIHQGNLFNGQLFDMRLSKRLCGLLILLLLVLISALAVVYTTNAYRLSLSQLQQLDQNRHHLQLQWSKLLLEQASLATPARVEDLAIKQLQMRLPDDKQTYVLQAQ